jgi:predicted component of type VI protein secretion system
MKVKLVVVQGKPEGMQIPLQGSQFVIGRDPKCNLRPNNDLVSKVHCAFLLGEDALSLKDLKSTNGTFVNGKKIDGQVSLKDGDLVKVGTLVFAVQIEAEKKASVQSEDGDDALQWLLGDAGSPDGELAEPKTDSTVMELKLPVDPSEAPTVEMTRPEAETHSSIPVQPGQSKPPEPAKPVMGNTQEAATAILNRYFVRRRNL